jgi:uncharacterized membrane protein
MNLRPLEFLSLTVGAASALTVPSVSRIFDYLTRPSRVSPHLALWAFIALATPLCIFMALAVPPGRNFDEESHILRADSLLHGELAGHRARLDAGSPRLINGLDADPALLGVTTAVARGQTYDWNKIAAISDVPWTNTVRFSARFDTIPVYAPVFYVPSAAVFAASKWLGVYPFYAILAARLVNVALFLLLGAAALAIAERGVSLLFCMLMVPMTLSMASSVGQDGLLIATCALGAALLMRSTGAVDDERPWRYAAAAVLLACVMAAKPGPYLALASMLILPLPAGLTGSAARSVLMRRLAIAFLAVIPALLWGAYALHNIATPLPRIPYVAGPLWPGATPTSFSEVNSAAQWSVVFAHPSLFVTLPWNYFAHERWWFLWEAIGQITDLQLQVPKFSHQIWEVAIVAAVCADAIRGAAMPAVVSWRSRVVLLLAAAVCAWGAVLAQYFIWTRTGYSLIEGPHGRYLLPIVPLIAVAMPYVTARDGAAWRSALRIVPVVVAASNLFFVPRMILTAFGI